ncbi:hypothetical protein HDU67_008295 [Dinochytrium kinnereticum]|nr:hypothetical protein HDU67_008295 [Dinochytrium kinnereticum]
MPLTNLPDEILTYHLAPHLSHKDLTNLCFQNHRLHQLLLPILLKSPTFTHRTACQKFLNAFKGPTERHCRNVRSMTVRFEKKTQEDALGVLRIVGRFLSSCQVSGSRVRVEALGMCRNLTHLDLRDVECFATRHLALSILQMDRLKSLSIHRGFLGPTSGTKRARNAVEFFDALCQGLPSDKLVELSLDCSVQSESGVKTLCTLIERQRRVKRLNLSITYPHPITPHPTILLDAHIANLTTLKSASILASRPLFDIPVPIHSPSLTLYHLDRKFTSPSDWEPIQRSLLGNAWPNLTDLDLGACTTGIMVTVLQDVALACGRGIPLRRLVMKVHVSVLVSSRADIAAEDWRNETMEEIDFLVPHLDLWPVSSFIRGCERLKRLRLRVLDSSLRISVKGLNDIFNNITSSTCLQSLSLNIPLFQPNVEAMNKQSLKELTLEYTHPSNLHPIQTLTTNSPRLQTLHITAYDPQTPLPLQTLIKTIIAPLLTHPSLTRMTLQIITASRRRQRPRCKTTPPFAKPDETTRRRMMEEVLGRKALNLRFDVREMRNAGEVDWVGDEVLVLTRGSKDETWTAVL